MLTFKNRILRENHSSKCLSSNVMAVILTNKLLLQVETPRVVRPEPPPPAKKEDPPSEYGYQQGGTMIVNMPQPLPPTSYQQHNLTAAQMGTMRNSESYYKTIVVT
jgi:hypothetical protein